MSAHYEQLSLFEVDDVLEDPDDWTVPPKVLPLSCNDNPYTHDLRWWGFWDDEDIYLCDVCGTEFGYLNGAWAEVL